MNDPSPLHVTNTGADRTITLLGFYILSQRAASHRLKWEYKLRQSRFSLSRANGDGRINQQWNLNNMILAFGQRVKQKMTRHACRPWT